MVEDCFAVPYPEYPMLRPVMMRSRTWLRRNLNKREWKNYLRWERNSKKWKGIE